MSVSSNPNIDPNREPPRLPFIPSSPIINLSQRQTLAPILSIKSSIFLSSFLAHPICYFRAFFFFSLSRRNSDPWSLGTGLPPPSPLRDMPSFSWRQDFSPFLARRLASNQPQTNLQHGSQPKTSTPAWFHKPAQSQKRCIRVFAKNFPRDKKKTSKNPPEGRICGTFMRRGQKSTLAKVSFDKKMRYLLALRFIGLQHNTPSICPTQFQSLITEHLLCPARTTSCLCSLPSAASTQHNSR